MRLKALTSSALILGIILVLMSPWVLRQRPRHVGGISPPRRAVASFQLMFAGYVGTCAFSFMTAGCLSMLMMRYTREEFSRQATANVQELVEGSMQDLRSRQKRGSGQ